MRVAMPASVFSPPHSFTPAAKTSTAATVIPEDVYKRQMMKFGAKLVRAWKPDAKLLFGDWNVHGEDVYKRQSCECMGDAAQNALGIYLKLCAPENFAFGGLTYRYDCDFAAELDALWDIGFDGMKMVEDKPTLRKQLGVPFNDRRYDGFYAKLEEKPIPILALSLIHI